MQPPPGWPPQGPGYVPPQNPYGQPPYGQGPYPQNPYGQRPPYGPPQPRPVDPVAQAANLALGFGLGAAVLCCVPIGAVGGFFGFKAMRLAKERNVATPGRAIVGIVLGVVSLLATFGVGVGVYLDKKAHDARLAEVEAKTRGKLEVDELDRSTACALFEKQLLKGLYQDSELVRDVKCVGGYDSNERRGTLDKVTFALGGDTIAVRGCLARANRWYAAGYVPYGVSCPEVKLESKKREGASEADLEAEEDLLRKSWKSAADERLVDDWVAALAKAEKAATGEHVEVRCKELELDGLGDKPKLPTVDALAVTDVKAANGSWSFLTASSARTALDPGADAPHRADAVRALAKGGGPYVVLLSSTERALPEVRHTGVLGKGFIAGGFVGWMSVVDTRSGKLVCDAPLKFENSETVSTRRFASDDALKSALKLDLESNYKKAAEAAIASVSSDKLAIDD